MVRNFIKAAMAVATFVAVPGIAQAGTRTATANVTMQVASQCTLTGATVYLGAFKTTDTWGTVAAKHGVATFGTYTVGTAGQESLKFGTVTCDTGLPWNLTIKGTANGTGAGLIWITVNGKFVLMYPGIKKVGTKTIADSGLWSGTGQQVAQSPVYETGTGAPQDLFGNVTLNFSGSTATSTTPLAVVGNASDTLTYTLTF